MKKLIIAATLALLAAATEAAAQADNTAQNNANMASAAADEAPARPKYGTVRLDSLLKTMPEYQHAQIQLAQLRRQHEAEATYNETAFRRMFAEFLQGQKDFPENILLKRQRELQEAMEKGIAFRQAADSLLRDARRDLEAPVRDLLLRAVRAAAAERGYELVVNLDNDALPFTDPARTENATPYIEEKLGTMRLY